MPLNKEVPEIPLANPLDGTEQLHIVQGGNSRRVTIAMVTQYMLGFTPYLIPFGFDASTSPLAMGEVLLAHTFAQAVNFADDFASSVGYLDDAPSAQVDLDVAKDTGAGPVSIATISLLIDGTVTFATTDEDVSFAIGDTMVISPLSTDGDLTTGAFALYGTRGG